MSESRAVLDVVRGALMSGAAGLVHGFSTRGGGVSRVYRPDLPEGDGDLNLGFTVQDNPENVRTNRLRFLQALPGTGMQRFALLRQMHTPDVRVIASAANAAENFTEPAREEGDGLVTDVPGVLLCVGAADCIPVLVFDPVRRAVGAFHAGWRGTLAGIVQGGVGAMRTRYGSDPADMLAVVGPGIGPASYVVSEAVRQEFAANFGYAPELFRQRAAADGDGTVLTLDLWEANRRQLLAAGVAAANVDVLRLDTAADTRRFFSHRAENGFTGRMLGAIGLTR